MVSSSRAPRAEPPPPPPPPPLLTPLLRGWRRPGCLDNRGRGGGARRTARGRDQKPRGNAGEREGPRACGATERGWRPGRRLQTLPPEPRRAFGPPPQPLRPQRGQRPGLRGGGLRGRGRRPRASVGRSVGASGELGLPRGEARASLPPRTREPPLQCDLWTVVQRAEECLPEPAQKVTGRGRPDADLRTSACRDFEPKSWRLRRPSLYQPCSQWVIVGETGT